jgi:2-polyprenyl-3-methyl-5-hydroxy-6-metoxy-1,4-benzoquinol methylase
VSVRPGTLAPVNERCGICGGPLSLARRGAADGPAPAAMAPTCHTTGAHGDLYACAACGTIQQPALPAGPELLDLYRDMEDDHYLDEEAGRRATSRRLLRHVEKVTPRGRLLEVGCGHGLLLDEARRRGWAVTGLEPARAARAHATETLGLEVRDALLDDLDPAAEGGFDAVVMSDVIEHLEDPVGALRSATRLLADGGALCVVTPDPSSATARLAGGRWWGYLPAHTYLLPRSTLRRLLLEAGLEPVVDVGLWRTFTVGYWSSGLGERSGPLGSALERLRDSAVARLPLTLSLGDESVMVGRRGVAAPAPRPAAAGPAPATS